MSTSISMLGIREMGPNFKSSNIDKARGIIKEKNTMLDPHNGNDLMIH
jgi:hypothetical protein